MKKKVLAIIITSTTCFGIALQAFELNNSIDYQNCTGTRKCDNSDFSSNTAAVQYCEEKYKQQKRTIFKKAMALFVKCGVKNYYVGSCNNHVMTGPPCGGGKAAVVKGSEQDEEREQ